VGSGTDIVLVSKLLGHAKISMTLDAYAHLMPESGEGDAMLDAVETALAAGGSR
jgi:integrase